MDERYEFLAEAGVRNIKGYNALSTEAGFPITNDANGSVVGWHSNEVFTWDIRGRLAGIRRTGTNPLTGAIPKGGITPATRRGAGPSPDP